jgi:hypothetical protein
MKRKILMLGLGISAFGLMSFIQGDSMQDLTSSKFWGTVTVEHDSYDPVTGCTTHYVDYHYYALWVNYDNLNNVPVGVDCP